MIYITPYNKLYRSIVLKQSRLVQSVFGVRQETLDTLWENVQATPDRCRRGITAAAATSNSDIDKNGKFSAYSGLLLISIAHSEPFIKNISVKESKKLSIDKAKYAKEERAAQSRENVLRETTQELVIITISSFSKLLSILFSFDLVIYFADYFLIMVRYSIAGSVSGNIYYVLLSREKSTNIALVSQLIRQRLHHILADWSTISSP